MCITDKYGRLLAYVWLSDGRMLYEVLIREDLEVHLEEDHIRVCVLRKKNGEVEKSPLPHAPLSCLSLP